MKKLENRTYVAKNNKLSKCKMWVRNLWWGKCPARGWFGPTLPLCGPSRELRFRKTYQPINMNGKNKKCLKFTRVNSLNTFFVVFLDI